jgi:hypothetical protein
MAQAQLTLNGVIYHRNEGSGGVDVVIGIMRRTTWTRSGDGAMSTGTHTWVAGEASLDCGGGMPGELEGRHQAMKLAH